MKPSERAAEAAEEIRQYQKQFGPAAYWQPGTHAANKVEDIIERAITAATSEAQARIQAQLNRVGGMPLDKLVDGYLRQMKELNERDKPAGFESWEEYHKHVADLQARVGELEAALRYWQHVYRETDCEYDDCEAAARLADEVLNKDSK